MKISVLTLALSCILALVSCSKPAAENKTAGDKKSSSSQSGNSALEGKIKSAIAADSSLAGANIQVDTSEANAITLRGTVKSEAQIDRAKEIAMKDPSVKAVWSKLKVQ